MVAPIFLEKFKSGLQHIAIVDQTGMFSNIFEDTEHLKFINLDKNTNLDNVDKLLKNMNWNALLYIPDIDINRPLGITLYSSQQIGLGTESYLRHQIESKISDKKLSNKGYSKEWLKQFKVKININTIIISKVGKKSANSIVSYALAQIMGFILYFVIFTYGSMTMKSIVEEKRNRIVEVLISSIKPFQLMMGKILGVAMVALTQLLIWIILLSIFGSLVFAGSIPYLNVNNSSQTVSQLNSQVSSSQIENIILGLKSINFSELIGYFLFFFLFGYLIYSSLFAAIGSIIDDDTETQTMTMPVVIPVIAAMLIMVTIIQQPQSNLAVWSSIFPLFSPIVMIARIPFGVPTWQIVSSIILLITTLLGFIWMAGKIYRTGILMKGKKVTFKELWKWLKVKN
jgi:ABC-2 type transport system permease protein